METVAPQEWNESKGWAGRDGPLLLGLKVKGALSGSSRNLARKLRQSRKKSAETIPDSSVQQAEGTVGQALRGPYLSLH